MFGDYIETLRWEHIIGTITVNATILQFFSGALVCRHYVYNKTTGEATILPFLCGLLSSSVWYFYGAVKGDDRITFVNLVGFILMLSYVVVFYTYALKKKEVKRQMLYCLVLSMLLFGYLSNEGSVLTKLRVSGTIACSLTLATIAAPLVKLYYVIKVKSTECLPFHMILMSFVVSGLWTQYGLMKQDAFLIMPNVLGCLLAAFQLSLFVIYPNTPTVPGAEKAGKTLQA